MGWGELDQPGSTSLEKTQTHRTDFQVGRKKRRKHTLQTPRVKSVTPENKPCHKGWMTYTETAVDTCLPLTIKEVGVDCQPPTTSLSFLKKQLREFCLASAGEDTVGQSHRTRITTFPSSLEGRNS